jgi:hypothetical protein
LGLFFTDVLPLIETAAQSLECALAAFKTGRRGNKPWFDLQIIADQTWPKVKSRFKAQDKTIEYLI